MDGHFGAEEPTMNWTTNKRLRLSCILLLIFLALKYGGTSILLLQKCRVQIFLWFNSGDSSRKLRLDTLIPIDTDDEHLLGPPGQVFRRYLPEFYPDIHSYFAADVPLLQNAIELGIHSYQAIPVCSNQLSGITFVTQVTYFVNFQSYDRLSSMYHEFEDASRVHSIKSGKAMVGRAFASQGVIVSSGQELGQRMPVEVVKVSPSDEHDSFEIGQPLSSNGENNVGTALLVLSCSSHKRDSLNYEGTVEVDLLLPHPIEKVMANRGTVNVDVSHDDHIEILEDTSEMMQLDSHSEQQNLEIDPAGNTRSNDEVEHSEVNRESNFVSGATTNNKKIHSQKNNAIQRIEKDQGITLKILQQHFGMTLEDAAKNLRGSLKSLFWTSFIAISRATLKRICKGYSISRWTHHKTRKVNHVTQGVSFQGAEPYVGDRQCPSPSQEKGPATGKPCDSMMTIKVKYRGDMIKFQSPFHQPG